MIFRYLQLCNLVYGAQTHDNIEDDLMLHIWNLFS